MRRGRKVNRKTIIALLVLLLVGITIGYAYLSANLKIGGNSNIKSNKWDIHFENVKVTDGSVITDKPATIDSTKQTINYTISLEKPGDFYEFTTSVVNAGTIDGKLGDNTNLIGPELTDAQKKYLNYVVTYENGNTINKGDLLKASDSKNVLVRVEYKKDLDNADLPKDGTTLNLTFNMEYIQDDGTGKDVDANMSASLRSLKRLQKLNNNIQLNTNIPDFNETAIIDEGIFKAIDDYGDSYYFRGAVTNNYVKFAGFYWRIVRINGDGSIRLIYDGTSAHNNGESSEDREIGTSVFNMDFTDNAYVGYMYGKIGASTYEETHVNTNNSTIKTFIDDWYTSNLASYSKYLSDTEFCNDRSIGQIDTYNNGYGTEVTYYSSRERLFDTNKKSPILICKNKNDRFTVSDTVIGNGGLVYSIGLLTVDEASMAGGVYNINNTSYYLYNGSWYWLNTPCYFYAGYSRVWNLNGDGHLYNYVGVNSAGGVRPVINLKSDAITSGMGTMDNPFVA